jgi:hypothetical protein
MISLVISGLDELLKAFDKLPDDLAAGVKVVGPATAYCLVWEYGSARMVNPGPKTLLSTNPLGQPAILSRQAPNGFIRINKQKYLDIIKSQFQQTDLGSNPTQWSPKLIQFLNASAELCADVISETAPVDTGNLSGSIQAAPVGDAALQGTPNVYGNTELNIGSDWF